MLYDGAVGPSREPIIITPDLQKTYYFPGHVYEKVFSILWHKAKESLSTCESIVIIGYSFPPTDFYTKKLFLESFSNNSKLKEVILVNPDKNLLSVVGNLCHFAEVKHYENLEKNLETHDL